jgi:hypothetical protein
VADLLADVRAERSRSARSCQARTPTGAQSAIAASSSVDFTMAVNLHTRRAGSVWRNLHGRVAQGVLDRHRATVRTECLDLLLVKPAA